MDDFCERQSVRNFKAKWGHKLIGDFSAMSIEYTFWCLAYFIDEPWIYECACDYMACYPEKDNMATDRAIAILAACR